MLSMLKQASSSVKHVFHQFLFPFTFDQVEDDGLKTMGRTVCRKTMGPTFAVAVAEALGFTSSGFGFRGWGVWGLGFRLWGFSIEHTDLGTLSFRRLGLGVWFRRLVSGI